MAYKEGDFRIIEQFLFLPRTLYNPKLNCFETRIFQNVKIKQILIEDMFFDYNWIDNSWVY